MDWIKLSEMQPKEAEEVISLYVTKDGSRIVDVGFYHYNEKNKQHRIVYIDLKYISAEDENGEVYWMPIPDPPKEAIT